MKKYIIYIGILAFGLLACEPEFENPVNEKGTYSSAEADFSNYVALGNSLTAGYADNALYITGQQNSYPNIVAHQFEKVGGGEFSQPLMADNAGGLLAAGEQITENRLVLSIIDGDTLPRVYTGMAPTTDVANHLSGYFNNMGVPGAKSYHLLAPGYGSLPGLALGTSNPYFVRFASSPDASVIQDAVAQDPTFFSLWIGNNDVLGYALSGGTGEDQTGNLDVTTYGADDITAPQVFAGVYSQMIDQLTAKEAKGVVFNIPNIADIPYFTRVPYAALDPRNPDFGNQIPMLNETFAPLNAVYEYLGVPERGIHFSQTGPSPMVIHDDNLNDIGILITQVLVDEGLDRPTATLYGAQFGQSRQATADDLFILTSSSIIGQLNSKRLEDLMQMGLPQETAAMLAINGVTYPMEDKYVLTPSELSVISTAIDSYNTTIKQLAEANNLAFVDANAMLQQLSDSGIPYDGGFLTGEFVTGGAFSLDGVHLTPRGYALVANKVIEAVNQKYGATVPQVNVGYYNTVTPNNEVN